jgi:hypothetical protein
MTATDELRKALDFMRIWLTEDAHLGESEISRELEKAGGLRKLDAIEQAIAAWNTRADDAPERPVDSGEADSRERLEADVRKFFDGIRYGFETAVKWLDRQAAITEREFWACYANGNQWEARQYELRCKELTAECDRLREKMRWTDNMNSKLREQLAEKQRVCDVQRDSFLKLERENRELQDVCGELERTIENMRGVE